MYSSFDSPAESVLNNVHCTHCALAMDEVPVVIPASAAMDVGGRRCKGANQATRT